MSTASSSATGTAEFLGPFLSSFYSSTTLMAIISSGGGSSSSDDNDMNTTAAATSVAAAAAATVAVVGFAYWSSSSTSVTDSIGTILLIFLKATGCEIGDDADNEEKEVSTVSVFSATDGGKGCGKYSKEGGKEIAATESEESIFISTYLDDNIDDEFYNSTNDFGPRSTLDLLTNSYWMSEMIRKLLSSNNFGTNSTQKEFHRSFRILRDATKETIKREPHIRENYFRGLNGYNSDSYLCDSSQQYYVNDDENHLAAIENDEVEMERMLMYLRFIEFVYNEKEADEEEERKKQEGNKIMRLCSLSSSFASSSSFSSIETATTASTTSSSTVSSSSISTSTAILPSSPSSLSSSSRWRQKQQRQKQRRRFKKLIHSSCYGGGDDEYELLRCVPATKILLSSTNSNGNRPLSSMGNIYNHTTDDDRDDDGSDKNIGRSVLATTIGHLITIHRNRKEIIIAITYDDESEKESSNNNDDEDYNDESRKYQLSSFTSSFSSSAKCCTNAFHRTFKNVETCLSLQLLRDYRRQQQSESEQRCGDTPAKGNENATLSMLDSAEEYLTEYILRYLQQSSTTTMVSLLSLIAKDGYTLVMSGHGMGAALACRVGIALKRKLSKNQQEGSSLTNDNVRVYAYGLPSCIPIAATTNEDDDDEDYSYIVTSIVNNHDCIPRLTASNLNILQKLLRWTESRKKLHLRKHFAEHQRRRRSGSTISYYHNRFNYYQKSSQQQDTTAATITEPSKFTLSSIELQRFWNHIKREQEQKEQEEYRKSKSTIIHKRKTTTTNSNANNDDNRMMHHRGDCNDDDGNNNNIDDHRHHSDDTASTITDCNNTVVPGKIVSIWNGTEDSNIIGTKVYHQRRRRRKRRRDYATNNETPPITATRSGSNNVLGQLWIDENMFGDHTIDSYRSNLELLSGQVANTI